MCQKALKKKPEERYASVQALQADVQAYLDLQPISLRRGEWGYVLQKYLQRNQRLAAIFTLAMVTIISLITFYTFELREERDLAQKEAAKARQISSLLSGMFSQANPNISLGEEPTASELLRQGTAQFRQDLQSSPELLAEMYQVLGGVYMDRAEFGKADTLLTEALRLQDSLSLAPSSEQVLSYYQLASLKYRSGAYEAARSLFLKGLEWDGQLPADAYSYRDDLLLELGNMEGEVGNYQKSDSLLALALAYNLGNEPGADSMQAMIHLGMGINARKLKAYDRAAEHYQKSLDLRRTIYPPQHPDIAHSLNHFASLYYDQRRYEEALPYAEESYQMRRSIFGEQHPETIASLSNLSRNLLHLGKYELARENYEVIYSNLEAIYGYPHQYLEPSGGSIANTYFQSGELSKALLMYQEALKILRESLPEDHIGLASGYSRLGAAHYAQGEYAEATPAFEEALRIKSLALPADHEDVALVKKDLGLSLLYQGKNTAGRQLLLHAREILAQHANTYEKELAEIDEGLGVMPLTSPQTKEPPGEGGS